MKPLNVEERLRLFRYGLIVVVIVAFLVSLLAPYVSLSFLNSAGVSYGLMDGLTTAIIFTVVVAVLAVVAYFGYRAVLMRTVNKS
jgi:hypothetical protein